MKTFALIYTLFVFTLLILATGEAIGSNQDAAARVMQNQAITAERQGHIEEATRIYENLVEKYPETQAAIEANKVLLEMTKRNSMEKVHIDDLMATLEVFRSETGRYPTTEEGFDALINAPVGMKNWQGPYLSNPNYLNFVKARFSYKLSDNAPEITRK